MSENVNSINTLPEAIDSQAGSGPGRGARRGGPPGARGGRGGRGGGRGRGRGGGGVVPIDQMFCSIKEKHEQRFGNENTKTLTEPTQGALEETKNEAKSQMSYGANRRKIEEKKIAVTSASAATHGESCEEEKKQDDVGKVSPIDTRVVDNSMAKEIAETVKDPAFMEH